MYAEKIEKLENEMQGMKRHVKEMVEKKVSWKNTKIREWNNRIKEIY